MERTHTAILESATQCFGRFGFPKTSIDDVAAGAGVAKGTVYLYCDSKQDLFCQAVEHQLSSWMREAADLLDLDRPAAEILTEMGRRDAAFVEDHPLVADLLMGVLDGRLPTFVARFAEMRRTALGTVIAVLELGIARGEFAPDLDVRAAARVLQEMQLAGSLLSYRNDWSPKEVHRHQAAALRLVLDGLNVR